MTKEHMIKRHELIENLSLTLQNSLEKDHPELVAKKDAIRSSLYDAAMIGWGFCEDLKDKANKEL